MKRRKIIAFFMTVMLLITAGGNTSIISAADFSDDVVEFLEEAPQAEFQEQEISDDSEDSSVFWSLDDGDDTDTQSSESFVSDEDADTDFENEKSYGDSEENSEENSFYWNGSGKNITSDEVTDEQENSDQEVPPLYVAGSSNLSVSQAGVDLIKKFEGCRLKAYKALESEKYYTIGYGHYGSDVYEGMEITKEEAEALLKKDLVRYVNYVNTFLNKYGITVNQNQFDALTSFTYNLGNVWVKYDTFQLKTYLIKGVSNYSSAQITTAFTSWNKAGGSVLAGLTKRRNAEAEMFLTGTSSCGCSNSYAGTYTCIVDSNVVLNIRSGHGTSYSVLGKIPSGATVTVSKGNGTWAHVTYNGISGYASMKYLSKQKEINLGTTSATVNVGASVVVISWNACENATGYDIRLYDESGNVKYAYWNVQGTSYRASGIEEGTYKIDIATLNSSSGTWKFGTRTSCTISYLKGEQTISDGDYRIISGTDSNYALTTADQGGNEGSNVRLWSASEDADQVYTITYLGNGYYKILHKNSGKSLDVDGNGYENGRNIAVYSYHGGENQQWLIRDSGDGKWFYIITKGTGKYLDAYGGIAGNNVNVNIWQGNKSAAQKWTFIAWGASTGKTVPEGEYHIVSALDSSKGIDVAGGATEAETNLQLYGNTNDSSQTFSLTYLGSGYYKLTGTKSGKVFDEYGRKKISGTNIQIYNDTGGDNQQWILKYAGDGYFYIISKNSGLYVDVACANTANGTNLWSYIGNGSAAQKWKFVPVERPEVKVSVKNDGTASFSWNKAGWADKYHCYIKSSDGTDYTKWNLKTKSCEVKLPDGKYTVYILGKNNYFNARGTKISFTVKTSYTVLYHSSNSAAASSKTSAGSYNKSITFRTISNLGFSKTGYTFKGWRVYRSSDSKWYAQKDGKKAWVKRTNGKLPSGYTYVLFSNGKSISRLASKGERIHLYAQWKANTYKVYYHTSSTASASSKTTTITYGTSTAIRTISNLGFTKTGYTFSGWKAYRSSDGKWYAQKNGKKTWVSLTNGKLPSGYSYALFEDGKKLAKAATSGEIHLYAQWKANTYKVYYHTSSTASASSKTTTITYGTSTAIRTISNLGFTKTGYTFSGWKAYRSSDGKWYAQKNGKKTWVSLTNGKLPSGYTYALFEDGKKLAKAATGGKIHLYAQWKKK